MPVADLSEEARRAQAYGMFVFNEETRTYWFSSASMEAGTEFRLVGQLMGLAIFNSVILDAHFPHCLYLKLLGKKPGFSVRSRPAARLLRTPHWTSLRCHVHAFLECGFSKSCFVCCAASCYWEKAVWLSLRPLLVSPCQCMLY